MILCKKLLPIGVIIILFSSLNYLILGCGGATSSTSSNAPTITTFSPTSDATSVSIRSGVSITFSASMDAATISISTFTLTSSLGATVTGIVTYDADAKIATFMPTSSLSYGIRYTAMVSTSIKDLNGESLSSLKIWSFTTITSSDAAQNGWVVLTTNVGSDTPMPILIGNYANRGDPTLGFGIGGENDVSFSPDDTNIGWLVGNAGDVIKTTDGGQSANFVNIGTSKTLQSVWAVSNNKVFICGRDETGSSLYYSSDGGTTWSSLESTTTRYPDRRVPFTDRLYALYFLEDGGTLYGWMAGGLSTGYSVILRSTDAGATTWTESYYQYYDPNELRSLAFFDKNNGITVGTDGTILTTADGGINWTKRTSGTTNILYEVKIISGTTAIAVGASGTVLKTTDSGITWSKLDVSDITTKALFALFVRMDKFWAGGDDGIIIYSSDGGATWKKQTSNTVGQIQSIYMLSDTTGWAVGAASSANKGVILRTTTGGE